MKTKTGKLVECGGFFKVATDKYKEEFGFDKGQVVLVIGDGMFPLTSEDPYLYRKYFAIVKFENSTINMDQKPLIVSADGLEDLPEEEEMQYQALLKAFEETYEMPD